MGSLDYPSVYPINPAFPNNGIPLPAGVLRVPPPLTAGDMQQPNGGSVPGLGSGATGALLGALVAYGAAHVLHHFAGSNADATPQPIDPNYRALTRRPSSPAAAETAAQPASSDTAGGVPDGLAAKAHDPSDPKVVNIQGAPSIASEDSPVPHPDDDDDDCMRQRNKERKACFTRQKRNPDWDYLNECLDRARVRWDLCNRGKDTGDLKPWGRRDER